MNQRSQRFYLDQFDKKNIKKWKQQFQEIAKYYWDHYCFFAHQRSLIFDKLKNSLASNCKSFEFSKWHRVISYQFSLTPLSARGSILNDPGGRFNIGDIDQIKFSQFPALYLAEDFETAYKEKYGLYQKEKVSGLTSEELALTSEEAATHVLVKGKIGEVLDITESGTLKDFFNLIKTIHLPSEFIKRATKLKIPPLPHVKSLNELSATLLNPHWRNLPMQVDIPANSQILGQIAHSSGIQGILYSSKMSLDKKCLAIFPENFAGSADFIQLEDGPTPSEVEHTRLDGVSYTKFL